MGEKFLTDQDVFRRFTGDGHTVKSIRRHVFPALFLFEIVQRGIFYRDKEIIFQIGYMVQRLATFPYFQEYIEDNLLCPLFRMQIVVGNTKETVETKIIKATQSSLGILFFDPP